MTLVTEYETLDGKKIKCVNALLLFTHMGNKNPYAYFYSIEQTNFGVFVKSKTPEALLEKKLLTFESVFCLLCSSHRKIGLDFCDFLLTNPMGESLENFITSFFVEKKLIIN